MQFQIVALSPADMPLIEAAPVRPGEPFGPCLLFTHEHGFVLGRWDGEAWADENCRLVRPERWLRLLP